jgi:hypothetical protein
MVNVCHYKPTRDMLDEPALALFQQRWQLYLAEFNFLVMK